MRPEGRLAVLWPQASTAKRDGPRVVNLGVNLGLNKEFGQRVAGLFFSEFFIIDTLRKWGMSDHTSRACCGGDTVTDPFNTYLICMPTLQHYFIILLYGQGTEVWGDYMNLGKTHGRSRIQIQICLTSRLFQKSLFPLDPMT